MMRKIRFILDVDDVLLHCNDTAVNYLNEERKTNYTVEDIPHWGLLNSPLDERLKYFQQEEFVLAQKPYDGAIEFVQDLRQRGEVFFVTDCPTTVKAARDLSLAKWFQAKPNEILSGSAKFLIRADFMLDDKIENIMGTATHQVNVDYPILMRRPWNQSSTGLLTVSNYQEALALIDSIISPTLSLGKQMPRVCSLVGPSGSGKNTIAKQLCDREDVERVCTYTTRSDGKEHRIISKEKFLELKGRDFFFETSTYLGEYYGTAKKDVDRILKSGKHALLVVDINGAMAMKAHYKNQAVSVFVERNKYDAFYEVVKNSSPESAANQLISWDMEASMSQFCDVVIHADAEAWKEEIKEVFTL